MSFRDEEKSSDGSIDVADGEKRTAVDPSGSTAGQEELRKSHEELRAFFSQTIDGCFFMMLDEPVRWDETCDKEKVLDYVFAHQRITQVNDAFLEQYGAARKQLLNLTPNDVYGHDLAQGRDLWRRFFDAGKIRLESDERKFDGTPMWIEGEYIAMYDSQGRITGHFGIQRDITERKRSEQSLLLFRSLIDQVNVGVEIIDGETGKFLDVNQSACVAHGFTREEYLSQTVSQIDPIIGARPWKEVSENTRLAKSLVVESEHRRKDGSVFPVEVNCTHVRLDRDYFLAVVHDITERKRAEKALAESEACLRQIAEVVAPTTGEAYFGALVKYLSDSCNVEYAFVVEVDPDNPTVAQTIAAARRGQHVSNARYNLAGTPCEIVLKSSLCFYPRKVQQQFPDDVMLSDLKIDSYMGIPLWSSDGRAIGLICLLNGKEFPEPERTKTILQVVAARSGAELERKQTENRLHDSEERLLAVIGNAPHVAIQWYDAEGRVMLWNEASQGVFGFTAQEAVGKTLDQLIHTPEEVEVFRATLAQISKTRQPVGPSEYTFRRRNGEAGTCLSSMFKIPGDKRGDWFVCMDVDITARKNAEEERAKLEVQILHSQKLESLGVLAGGIAHDFNNLLTAILGYASLAQTQLAANSPVSPMLGEIEKAAERAAELTKQLLAYAGKGKFVVGPLRLDALVLEMNSLLQTVVSKKAAIELQLAPATVDGDAAQIRQVVMNLMTNASDALAGEVGKIAIRTGVRELSETDLRFRFAADDLAPGAFAFIEIQDSGCGMSEETLGKIFDPFFTTKFTGRGLGLAAVLGIVRGHRGAIRIASTPGGGTLFEVLIPASTGEAAELDGARFVLARQGKGTVLVVDDEPMIRDLAESVLEQAGFAVLCAEDGERGMQQFIAHRREIVAVFLDLTMPRMDGLEALRKLRPLAPGVPVVVMSGYSELEVSKLFAEAGASGFIQKPFQPRELVERLHDLLPADAAGD